MNAIKPSSQLYTLHLEYTHFRQADNNAVIDFKRFYPKTINYWRMSIVWTVQGGSPEGYKPQFTAVYITYFKDPVENKIIRQPMYLSARKPINSSRDAVTAVYVTEKTNYKIVVISNEI